MPQNARGWVFPDSVAPKHQVKVPAFNVEAIAGYRQALDDLAGFCTMPATVRDLVSMGARPTRFGKRARRNMEEWKMGYRAGLLAAVVTIHDDLRVAFVAKSLLNRINI